MKRLILWFVLVGLNVPYFCQGSDPLDNWIWRNPRPTGEELSHVTYANSQFVAVGRFGAILTSPDGIDWTPRTKGSRNITSSTWRGGIAYGNGRFVVPQSINTFPYSSYVLTSTDGKTWMQSPVLLDVELTAICYGNGLFASVSAYATTTPGIFTSPEGTNWTRRVSSSALLFGVTYGNGLFVAVGDSIYTSTNGTSWSKLGVIFPAGSIVSPTAMVYSLPLASPAPF